MNKIVLFFITLTTLALGQTREDYFNDLVTSEGIRSEPYRDTRGNLTVGIGHNLTAHDDFAMDMVCFGVAYATVNDEFKNSYTEKEIMTFFDNDLKESLEIAQRNLWDFDSLPKNVKIAVVNLIWSVGERGFVGFKKFRAAVSRRDFRTAEKELRDSRWARQVQKSRLESNCARLICESK